MSATATVRGIPRPLVRGNQAFIVASVALAITLHAPIFLVIALAVQVLGLIGGPNLQPVFIVVRSIYGERLETAPKEAPGSQRFNNILAVLFFVVSIGGLYGLGNPALGWGAAVVVAVAAGLAFFGFCIGCHIYDFLRARAGFSLEPQSEGRSSL